jgi:glycosyltransferase involved in cell wall biosynthesis
MEFDAIDLPTIAVVTPTYNHAHVLEAAMRSVLDQGYPNLQYVVVDGGSDDGTHELLDRYRGRLHAVVEEPDRGPHDALNKGFALTDGTVMGWLNADDLLLPGSLLLVGSIFRDFADVRWLTGAHYAVDPFGRPASIAYPRRWTRWHLLSDQAHGWIPQESTFFRRDLWDEAGGTVGDIWGDGDTRSFPHAFDFELWGRFSRLAPLQTVEAPIGCYRYLPGQQGTAHLDKYEHFATLIRRREQPVAPRERLAKSLAEMTHRLARTGRLGRLQIFLRTALGSPEPIVFEPSSYQYRRRPTRRIAATISRALGAPR